MIEKTIVDVVVSEMNNCFRENEGCFSITRDIFTARLQSFMKALFLCRDVWQ